MELTAVRADIRPAHVINQEEQEIGLLSSLRIQETTKGTEKNKGAKQGAHIRKDSRQAGLWQWLVNYSV